MQQRLSVGANFSPHMIMENLNKRFVFSFVSKIISVVLGLLFIIILTKNYNAEVVGVVALIESYSAVIIGVVLFGTNNLLLKEVSSEGSCFNKHAVFVNSVLVVILISILCFISAVLINNIFLIEFSIYVMTLIVISRAVTVLLGEIIRANKLDVTYSLFQILPLLVKLFVICLLIYFWDSEMAPVYTIVTAAVITPFLIYTYINVKLPEFTIRIKLIRQYASIVSITSISETFKKSRPYFMSGFLSIYLTQQPTLLIGYMLGVEFAGYYMPVAKIAMLIMLVTNSITTVTASRLAESYSNNKYDLLMKYARDNAKKSLIVTLPMFIIFMILSSAIITTLFGNEYLISLHAMWIVMVGQLFNAINGPTGFFLNLTKGEKHYLIILIRTVVVSLPLSLILIDLFGINGAALSYAISTIIWNVNCQIWIHKNFGGFIYAFSK